MGVPLIKGARERAIDEEDDVSDEAQRSSPPVTTAPTGERLAALEDWRRGVDKRLAEGAVSFGQFRAALEKIVDRMTAELDRVEHKQEAASEKLVALVDAKLAKLAPVQVSWWQKFAAVVAALAIVGTAIATFARAPGRDEFERLNNTVQELRIEIGRKSAAGSP